MIIKLHDTADPRRAVIIYTDGIMDPEIARECGTVLAHGVPNDKGGLRWTLAVKGAPPAPRDVVGIYACMKFGEFVHNSGIRYPE